MKLPNIILTIAVAESTEETIPGMSRCVHVSDVSSTTWSDILHRQQAGIKLSFSNIFFTVTKVFHKI